MLLETARSFDSVPDYQVKQPKRLPGDENDNFIESPFEAFNKRGSVNDVLVSHGWTQVKSYGNKIHYKRPGDTKAKSSGNYDRERAVFLSIRLQQNSTSKLVIHPLRFTAYLITITTGQDAQRI